MFSTTNSTCACQGLLILAGLISQVHSAETLPWTVVGVEIQAEVIIQGVDFPSPVSLLVNTYYLESGFLITINDQGDQIVVLRSYEQPHFRYWKEERDRLFGFYSSNGLVEITALASFIMQYPFLLRPDKRFVPGWDSPGRTYRFATTPTQAISELSIPIPGGTHTVVDTFFLQNAIATSFSRSISTKFDQDSGDIKAGESRESHAFTASFTNHHHQFPQIPTNITFLYYDDNRKQIIRTDSVVRKVTPIEPSTSLDELTATRIVGLTECATDTPNSTIRHLTPAGTDPAAERTDQLNTLKGVAAISAALAVAALGLTGLRKRWTNRGRRSGITLVELLVVISILLLLGSLVLINLLYAQTRAKTAKAYAELTMLRNGVLAYRSDYNSIPRMTIPDFPYYDRYEGKGSPFQPLATTLGFWMTTPVSYVSAFDILHPFDRGPGESEVIRRLYGYHERFNRKLLGITTEWTDSGVSFAKGGDFFLACLGPSGFIALPPPRPVYDPTNGLLSVGFLYVGTGLSSQQ